MTSVVVIGEGMLEFARVDAAGLYAMRSAGDALNVAIYLARLGCDVRFLTALGTDSYSNAMRAEWASEGIDLSLTLTHPSRSPGLYLIETNAGGERSFHYWRDRSAARALFDCVGIEAAIDRASNAQLIYLSGITLSLFTLRERKRLIELCAEARRRGARIAFDTNYRPQGWPSAAIARDAFAKLAPLVDIALPTFEDEHTLYDLPSAEEVQAQWHGWGASDVVVKLGAAGALVSVGGRHRRIVAEAIERPTDTTGAGDSFNAAYLEQRMAGAAPADAARAGNRLAAAVVRCRGAILPASDMPF